MVYTWPWVLLSVLSSLILHGHNHERPVAVLSLQPNWTQIFRGESVTFRCIIQGGGDTHWDYSWNINHNKPEYRINPVSLSDTGSYTCQGNTANRSSIISDAVKLNVSNRPKAVLSISPQWLNPGDSVTLICEVKEPSTGWRFSWYKTVPYRTGSPSLLYKSYSVEPLSGYETTEESYTLTQEDMCVELVEEPQSIIKITVNLSISGQEGNSTGWRLMRYTETGVESGCSSNWRSITGSTCNITSTSTGDSGVYWCESGSGQSSNAVNITVSGGDVILESPVHPVTEGNSVTLHCIYRYQPQTNTNIDFYKDGVLIRNGTTGEMTIPTVSKSDEGSGFNRIFSSNHPQSINQEPQQDQRSTQVQSPDAGYTGDVTYAKIQRKTLDKKRREKPTDPIENPVYSVVKIVPGP
ncbi:hypothetical protein DPEC_G00099070 [Dallia pectoralis]|uniref:Uncharacterized protein n=1 Tax=Dallia pectoralis TaxID=75939 RepID=A0ACC2GW02_DALPE|nr:hypothetical protein DPEC_G00099070 [Dallia pectoralis]